MARLFLECDEHLLESPFAYKSAGQMGIYLARLSAISVQRPTSKVHRLKDVTAQVKEILASAVAWPVHLYRNDLLDSTRRRSHDNDAVADAETSSIS